MKIAHNNKVNFNGAYIIKGSAKSVSRFENELNSKSTTNNLKYPINNGF